MDKIIFADGSGGISIVSPAPEYQENLEELAAQVVPSGVPFRVLNDAAFPQDRNYRSAWVFDFDDPDAVIAINPVKAAEIDRNNVPATITNFQARALLMQMPGNAEGRTLFQDVDEKLQQLGGVAYQAWEYTTIFPRDSELIATMAAQFNLTNAQLDEMFIAAVQISV